MMCPVYPSARSFLAYWPLLAPPSMTTSTPKRSSVQAICFTPSFLVIRCSAPKWLAGLSSLSQSVPVIVAASALSFFRRRLVLTSHVFSSSLTLCTCFAVSSEATMNRFLVNLTARLEACLERITTAAPGPTSTVLSPRRSAARKRSEEHTSELQSRGHLVCRLLLEK